MHIKQIFTVRNLMYAVFVGVIAGQLVRLRLSSEAASAVLLIDVLLGLYVALGGFYVLAARFKIPRTFSLIFLGYFVIWVGVTLLLAYPTLSSHQFLTAFFYAFRFCLMVASIFITLTLFKTERTHVMISNAFVTSGIILTVLGFLQLIIFPNFSFMAKFGWDPHNQRLLSTFFDPNFFGMFLVMLFSVLLARLFFIPRMRNRILCIIFLGATALAIVATLSRSTYLAFAIATSFILLMHSWRLFFVLVIAAVIAIGANARIRDRIVGAFKLDASSSVRLISWSRSLTITKDHPIAGVGYNAYGAAQYRYGFQKDLQNLSAQGADSSILLIAATTGIIGLVIYLAFFASLFIEALFVYQHSASPFFRSIGLAMFGLLPAYLVHSQFVNGLFYPLLFIPFGFIVANLLAGVKKYDTA